jgi:hypothetical protein
MATAKTGAMGEKELEFASLHSWFMATARIGVMDEKDMEFA